MTSIRLARGSKWCFPGLVLAAVAMAIARAGNDPARGTLPPLRDPRLAFDPDAPCAAVSAAVVARALERPVSLAEAKRAIAVDPVGGTSMAELIDGMRVMGFAAVGVRLSPEALGESPVPAILHVDGWHFVAALPRGRGTIALVDPPLQVRLLTVHDLAERWTGAAALVGRDEEELARSIEQLGFDGTPPGAGEHTTSE